MTSLPQAKRFDWPNLGLRVASALVLIPLVLWATWVQEPRWPFLVLIAVGVALLAIEWGGMSAPRAPLRVAAMVTAAILLGVFLAYLGHPRIGWLLLLAGAVAAGLVAKAVTERPADAGYGVLYIAPAAICLVWLRNTNQGQWWTLMLFAVTWAADIGAFAVGSTLKGPKLWPRFSPNKTWSGFVGGLAAATLVGTLMSALSSFQLNLWAAALIGLAVGLATMAGDLWESALKRRFGVKDSGDPDPRPWRSAGPRRRPDVRRGCHGAGPPRQSPGVGTLSLPRKVSVLGSTGSIGVSTLDLFARAGAEVEVVALTAGRNVERLAEQALRWRPQVAVIEDENLLPLLRAKLADSGVEAAAGSAAVAEAAGRDAQWVMSAIVGFAGLAPTLAAARTGAVVALANKESLVCAGPSLLRLARRAGGMVIPVDSEHSAIFQVLAPQHAQQVSRLI